MPLLAPGGREIAISLTKTLGMLHPVQLLRVWHKTWGPYYLRNLQKDFPAVGRHELLKGIFRSNLPENDFQLPKANNYGRSKSIRLNLRQVQRRIKKELNIENAPFLPGSWRSYEELTILGS
ncbi:unnamed protein product [Hermetia illucens]|uniref:Uncharacterized protein n=1 Tax=Hermetia illucens TaxID=343691 RepID=A0A7R8Z0F0_HERIL|nr:unnamed protein product [Hermetia illucens]